jgi:pilus assembly protein Flp/PilA
MTWLFCAIKRFLQSDEGPTAVEYAVLLSFILIVCILAIGHVGKATSATYQSAANSIAS